MTNNGFNCPTCGKPFKTKQGLKVHVTRTHKRKEKSAAKRQPFYRRKPRPEE